MRVVILTANLGNFDAPVDPVAQNRQADFHRFTDEDFPPITGVSPRMQYRIPKTHGWQMMPGYDYYVWLDGSMSLQNEDSVAWMIGQLGNNRMGVFAHPDRTTAREEVEFVEKKLEEEHPYIVSRYKNGLHREQYESFDPNFEDKELFHTGVFIYRNSYEVKEMLKDWWYEGTRYYTVDQVVFPYLLWKHKIRYRVFDEPIYETKYITQGRHI